MKCLSLYEIYLYLENELSPSKMKNTAAHLASCERCRQSVEEREIFLQAAESLPVWETPPDFTHQVMSKIFPEKVSFRSWLTAAAAGLMATSLALFLFLTFSEENSIRLFVSLNQRLWAFLQNFSIFFVKFLKLVYFLIRIILQSAVFLFRAFSHLTTTISPEIQIILIILTLVLSASLFFGLGKKLLTGGKI